MNILAETNGRIYGALMIDAPGDLVAPFQKGVFTCLLWDHGGRFSDVERSAVARVLLDSGCRYVVCGGETCESWHDAVDAEFVQQHLEDSQALIDTVHVMTTWHESESPDDVAFFFVLNTNFDDHDFSQYLVLHVGTGEARDSVDAAVRNYALSVKAV